MGDDAARLRDAYGPSPEAEYLTPAELAQILQVKATKTVLRWASADPTMPVLRIAGTVRFPKARVLRWLQDREQGRPRAKRLMPSVTTPHHNGPIAAEERHV
jgi:hypothetical protein